MPRRIDIDGSDPQNEIEEALRQLTQQKTAQPKQELERAVQEMAVQQKTESVRIRKKTASRSWGKIAAWSGIIVVVLGLILAVVLLGRQEPPPPPATSPEDAVQKFWTALIQGKYETATAYYPQLQMRYGSAVQAGARLRDTFKDNPPTSLRQVGPSAPTSEAGQYSVPYKVYKRSGQPTDGEFLVNDTGAPSTGFVITSGGV